MKLKKTYLLIVAMVCTMHAMALGIPSHLAWDGEAHVFSWNRVPDAYGYSVYMDGARRSFMQRDTTYLVSSQWLSPGTHSFAVNAVDTTGLLWSEYAYLTILVSDDTIDTKPPYAGPEGPVNLRANQLDSCCFILYWDDHQEGNVYSVFLDDDMLIYSTTAHSHRFNHLSTGEHKLGVCAIDTLGYVSDQVSVTVTSLRREVYSVMLNEAHWEFENSLDVLISMNNNVVSNSNQAEYAFSASLAYALSAKAGQIDYLLLPYIADVTDYSNLELRLMARGGYWSYNGVWGKSVDAHRLQIGSFASIPTAENFLSSVQPLLDTTLTYATIDNCDDQYASPTMYWHEIVVPLQNALPYIAIYTDAAGAGTNNYVVVDNLRIRPISHEPQNPDNGLQNTENGMEEISVENEENNIISKHFRQGQIIIRRGSHEYSILGTRVF